MRDDETKPAPKAVDKAGAKPPAPGPGRAPSARFLAAGGEAPKSDDPMAGLHLGQRVTLKSTGVVDLKMPDGSAVPKDGVKVVLSPAVVGWITGGLATAKAEA